MQFRLTIVALAIAAPVAAQPDPQPPPQPQPQPQPSLEDRVKALETDLEDSEDINKDLQSQIDDLKDQIKANKPPISLNALNPQITAFLNGATRFDDKPVFSPEGARIDDRLFMRTMEVDFRAAVDPYADAVAILSLEDEAGEGFGADLEEGYVVVKRLPILESAPLGLKLKLGRYRAPIGISNVTHMHDQPWTTRPLAVARMLGTENGEFFESGFNPVGADAQVILPTIIPDAVMELNADVVDGGHIAISGTGPGEHRHLGYLGHYNLFFTVHDSHDFNLGVSAYYERGDHRAGLVAGDFMYKWKPIAAGEFHSVVLGGEVMYADRKFAADTDGDGVPDMDTKNTPFAWYAFGQVQLDWHFYLGGRYDYAQDIVDDKVATQVAGGYLSYYTSEFLRFRVGYEHRWSDNPAEDNVNTGIAEVNVVFGSHPTEPYWVNR